VQWTEENDEVPKGKTKRECGEFMAENSVEGNLL